MIYNKEFWYFYNKYEDGNFLNAMFTMYLKRNNLWEKSYKRIIGADYHFRSSTTDEEFDQFDDDIVEVFILVDKETIKRKYFLFSDFLTWQEERIIITNNK